MKFKKIMLLFLFALPACITMRTLQLNFTVEEITGFFTYESGNYGKILLICIFAICLGTAIFSFFNTTKPQKPPKTNILLSISACLLGAAIFYETFFLDLPDTTAIWQILLLRLTGVLAGIYFIIYGLAPIWRFELPEVVSVFPTLYLIARMICDFTTISKLALISDNVILIVTYCVLLLFLLNYAKLYNKSDEKRNSEELSFTIKSDVFAHAVHFNMGEDKLFSDQYFDLLPGESRWITLENAGGILLNDLHADCIYVG